MNNLSFGTFTWPNDPETYQEKVVREPVYGTDGDGNKVLTGVGPVKRTITGSGAFFGAAAYTSYQALLALVSLTEPATLTHPVWGTCQVYLAELTSNLEAREDYVAYSFVFLEAEETTTG